MHLPQFVVFSTNPTRTSGHFSLLACLLARSHRNLSYRIPPIPLPMSTSNPCSFATTATPRNRLLRHTGRSAQARVAPSHSLKGGIQLHASRLPALALNHAVPPGSARPARRRRPGCRPAYSRPCSSWYVINAIEGRTGWVFTEMPKAFSPTHVTQNKIVPAAGRVEGTYLSVCVRGISVPFIKCRQSKADREFSFM